MVVERLAEWDYWKFGEPAVQELVKNPARVPAAT